MTDINIHEQSLTLPQQVEIRKYELDLARQKDLDILRQHALGAMRINMQMHNAYKKLIAHEWGIELNPAFLEEETDSEPIYWTAINSTPLHQAVAYYRDWLLSREISSDSIKHAENITLVKTYFIGYLGKECWGNEMNPFRDLAEKIQTIEDIASLHRLLTTCGVDPIH